MSNNFTSSLPSEIQSEIFCFLSLKHLSTILSINKSIYQLIDSNNSFWDQLIKNYSKIAKPTDEWFMNEFGSLIKGAIYHQENQENSSSNIEKHSRLLKELIATKNIYLEQLQSQLKSLEAKKIVMEAKLEQIKQELEFINENDREMFEVQTQALEKMAQKLENQCGSVDEQVEKIKLDVVKMSVN